MGHYRYVYIPHAEDSKGYGLREQAERTAFDYFIASAADRFAGVLKDRFGFDLGFPYPPGFVDDVKRVLGIEEEENDDE